MPDQFSPISLTRDDSADYQAAVGKPPAPPAEKTEDDRKKKLIDEAMDRFRLVLEVEGDQRQREVDDLKFDRAFPEDQWPEDIRNARAGGIAPDGTVIHERPCLVINKLDAPVQQVINEARKSRLAIIVKPKGNGANQEGAELRQGMIRAIEGDSRANIARI
ncbi:MAG: hypothetical protein WC876_11730, partial [Candidatus Thermoplasmatota archaeon]